MISYGDLFTLAFFFTIMGITLFITRDKEENKDGKVNN